MLEQFGDFLLFEELPFFPPILPFSQEVFRKNFEIEIKHPKQFKVSVDQSDKTNVPDLDAAIQFVFGEVLE